LSEEIGRKVSNERYYCASIKYQAYFYIALLSILGGILLWVFTNVNGVGMSPDSAQYIAVSRSLMHGDGF
jgi:hypothetical protein